MNTHADNTLEENSKKRKAEEMGSGSSRERSWKEQALVA